LIELQVIAYARLEDFTVISAFQRLILRPSLKEVTEASTKTMIFAVTAENSHSN